MGLWSRVASVVGRKINCNSLRPIVSFTFDDAPLSSFACGGSILETYGFRGTYYVSSGLVDKVTEVGKIADFDSIHEFYKHGHEIANHTYGHIDCKKTGLVGIVNDVRRNQKELSAVMTGSFAYPYGSRDARARVAAHLCTTSARGISHGINRDVIDVTDLKAARVYDRLGIDTCLNLISECAAAGGWLIFYTHDVCDEPSAYGCTPDQLARLVRAIHDRQLTVEPVGQALQRVLEQARDGRNR